jgi:hypothetical protein
MPFPIQDTTHVTETLALLISRYKAQKVVSGMVTALSQEVQALEDAAWQIINALILGDTPMVGGPWDIYDKYAAIVGVPGGRLGRSDADLLTAIKIQIAVNRSEGKAEDIIQITALLAPTGATYSESYPASWTEQVLGTTVAIANALGRYLNKAKSAGTGANLVFTLSPTTAFILDSTRVALAAATPMDSSRTPGSFPATLAALRGI